MICCTISFITLSPNLSLARWIVESNPKHVHTNRARVRSHLFMKFFHTAVSRTIMIGRFSSSHKYLKFGNVLSGTAVVPKLQIGMSSGIQNGVRKYLAPSTPSFTFTHTICHSRLPRMVQTNYKMHTTKHTSVHNGRRGNVNIPLLFHTHTHAASGKIHTTVGGVGTF